MNLIEQFGGYEYLNEFYKRAVAHGFALTEIKDELLKHRRQHNIFEVGDKVVSNHENIHLFNDEVLEIEFFRNLGEVEWVRFTNGNDYRVDALRHATDEEIKAGRRL